MNMGNNMNMVAGILMGSIQCGVVFEKFDSTNNKLYISVPSNFGNSVNEDGIASAVQRQKQIFIKLFHFDSTFRIRFTVRNEVWTEEDTHRIAKDIEENGLIKHVERISNFVAGLIA